MEVNGESNTQGIIQGNIYSGIIGNSLCGNPVPGTGKSVLESMAYPFYTDFRHPADNKEGGFFSIQPLLEQEESGTVQGTYNRNG